MEKVHDDALLSETLAFNEKDLFEWLNYQAQDRRIQEFKYVNNEEFIKKLIDVLNASKTDKIFSDKKLLELQNIEKHLKNFLQKNTNFLIKLEATRVSGDSENKDLAEYLLNNLFEKMLSEKFDLTESVKDIKIQKLKELQTNFGEKIQEFCKKLSNEELSNSQILKLNAKDYLILELILKIPTKIDDILKTKPTEKNPFEYSYIIKEFDEFLGKRKSITDFRDLCSKCADIYCAKAKDLKDLQVKTSASR
jgi:hypothetical protein